VDFVFPKERAVKACLTTMAKITAVFLSAFPLLAHGEGNSTMEKNCRTQTSKWESPKKVLEQDNVETREQCQRAAKQGDAAAQTYVGWMYWEGLGVKKDNREAMKWFNKAAKQGYAPAQHYLGWMSIRSIKREGDGRTTLREEFIDHDRKMKEAQKWYQKAADQGYAPAQHDLAGLAGVSGSSISYAEGDRLYRLAAEQGYEPAQINLANRYKRRADRHRDPKRPQFLDETKAKACEVEALKWYRKAAEQGNMGAQRELGKMLAEGQSVKDEAEAVRQFRLMAEQGSVVGQYELGKMIAAGRGVKKDEAEAVRLFRLAAKEDGKGSFQGEMQYELGKMYLEGRGVKKDDAEALKWHRLAAENGDSSARFELGKRYAEGRGVEKDESEALKWYRKATPTKDGAAEFEVGKWHADGRCVEQSGAAACKAGAEGWYRDAAEKGHLGAKEALRKMGKD